MFETTFAGKVQAARQQRGAMVQCASVGGGIGRARSTTLRAKLGFIAIGIGLVGASGCVPVPYRPSASVSRSPVDASTATSIVVSFTPHQATLESLAHSIHKAEPRILVATQPATNAIFSQGSTLAEILEPAHANEMAAVQSDYLLTVGPTVHHQLHDTGAAAPFIYLPVIWVGYEKVQSIDTFCASLADLHNPLAIDGLLVASPYTEVIAALVYGVGTVAMPENPMRRALAEEVAHRLAAANPTGDIRLTLLAQDGGDVPGTHSCTPEPANTDGTRADHRAANAAPAAAGAPAGQ